MRHCFSPFLLCIVCLAARASFASEGSAEQAVTKLTQKVGPAIVRLGMFHGDEQVANGTGFIVRQDGIVVTNHHVAADAPGNMVAIFSDGRTAAVVGTLALDEEHDLALLKIVGGGYPVLELADGASLNVGEQLVLVGSSKGFDQSVGVGIISAIRLDGYPDDMRRRMEKADGRVRLGPLIQHTATAAPGASGSPLVNAKGQVVSVHHSSWGDGSEINFSAHVDALKALLGRTNLEAEPTAVGPNVRRNLLISAGVFSAFGMLAIGIKRASTRTPRRRPIIH